MLFFFIRHVRQNLIGSDTITQICLISLQQIFLVLILFFLNNMFFFYKNKIVKKYNKIISFCFDESVRQIDLARVVSSIWLMRSTWSIPMNEFECKSWINPVLISICCWLFQAWLIDWTSLNYCFSSLVLVFLRHWSYMLLIVE